MEKAMQELIDESLTTEELLKLSEDAGKIPEPYASDYKDFCDDLKRKTVKD